VTGKRSLDATCDTMANLVVLVVMVYYPYLVRQFVLPDSAPTFPLSTTQAVSSRSSNPNAYVHRVDSGTLHILDYLYLAQDSLYTLGGLLSRSLR